MALEIKNEIGWHNYNVLVVSEGGMIVGTFADRTDAELFVRARELRQWTEEEIDEWNRVFGKPARSALVTSDDVQPDTILEKEPA